MCNLPVNTGKSFPLTPPLTNHLHIQLPLQVAILRLVFSNQSSSDISSNLRSPMC